MEGFQNSVNVVYGCPQNRCPNFFVNEATQKVWRRTDSLNQKNTHDIPNHLKTCIFFCEKPTTQAGHCIFFVRGQNVFQSSEKKDVCGVPKWRIIYYFRGLKIVRWLAPYLTSCGFKTRRVWSQGWVLYVVGTDMGTLI